MRIKYHFFQIGKRHIIGTSQINEMRYTVHRFFILIREIGLFMDQLIEFATANALLSGIWLALVALLLYTFIAPLLSPVKNLTTHEVTQKINKEDAVILDIRKPEEFKKGHITGARQLKADEINQANFTKLEKYKNTPIIVVCPYGMNAGKTAHKLAKAGFSQAFTLKGGMEAWSSANLPVTK